MDAQESKGEDQQTRIPTDLGFKDMVVHQYKKIKENAESYPYVWGSYIVVYGTIGLWITYRWRALRKMEDRVRALQEKCRKQYESEQSAATSGKTTPRN